MTGRVHHRARGALSHSNTSRSSGMASPSGSEGRNKSLTSRPSACRASPPHAKSSPAGVDQSLACPIPAPPGALGVDLTDRAVHPRISLRSSVIKSSAMRLASWTSACLCRRAGVKVAVAASAFPWIVAELGLAACSAFVRQGI
jgi:hypothetical protein